MRRWSGRTHGGGSSPLARGAPPPPIAREARPGLIPARAGSTRSWPHPAARPRAHPRSRGEHKEVPASEPVRPGSSPLARGAPGPCAPDRSGSGLIPARAGSTCFSQKRLWWYVGSSPLARGARTLLVNDEPWFGLIPARAGSTPRRAGPRPARAAHPRSRGEHIMARNLPREQTGSSPLARGARRGAGGEQVLRRLIPARAGSTGSNAPPLRPASAHPRSRGEHVRTVTIDGEPWGSSPLARGARWGCCVGGRGRGLIPARAGSTSPRRSGRSGTRAHPRSRGEHTPRCLAIQVMGGSSPRERG